MTAEPQDGSMDDLRASAEEGLIACVPLPGTPHIVLHNRGSHVARISQEVRSAEGVPVLVEMTVGAAYDRSERAYRIDELLVRAPSGGPGVGPWLVEGVRCQAALVDAVLPSLLQANADRAQEHPAFRPHGSAHEALRAIPEGSRERLVQVALLHELHRMAGGSPVDAVSTAFGASVLEAMGMIEDAVLAGLLLP